VHSFDLVAKESHITACNIAHVPLKPGTLDIAIFCLSLMGTNFLDYIKEANRVLKKGGLLKIAEVESRFKDGIDTFVDAVTSLGFTSIPIKDPAQYKMFLLFDFRKSAEAPKSIPNGKNKIVKLDDEEAMVLQKNHLSKKNKNSKKGTEGEEKKKKRRKRKSLKKLIQIQKGRK